MENPQVYACLMHRLSPPEKSLIFVIIETLVAATVPARADCDGWAKPGDFVLDRDGRHLP